MTASRRGPPAEAAAETPARPARARRQNPSPGTSQGSGSRRDARERACTYLTADPAVEILKALAEPVRLDIMARIVAVDELACTTLEKELPISKSTISYHMKLLYHARLIDIRKEGRYYHYRARTTEIEEVIPGLSGWLRRRSSNGGLQSFSA